MEPLTEESPGYYVRGGQVHGRWLVYGANVDVETGQEIERRPGSTATTSEAASGSTGPSAEGQRLRAPAQHAG